VAPARGAWCGAPARGAWRRRVCAGTKTDDGQRASQ